MRIYIFGYGIYIFACKFIFLDTEFWVLGAKIYALGSNFVFLRQWRNSEMQKFRHYFKNTKFRHYFKNAKFCHCLENTKIRNFVTAWKIQKSVISQKHKISSPKIQNCTENIKFYEFLSYSPKNKKSCNLRLGEVQSFTIFCNPIPLHGCFFPWFLFCKHLSIRCLLPFQIPGSRMHCNFFYFHYQSRIFFGYSSKGNALPVTLFL